MRFITTHQTNGKKGKNDGDDDDNNNITMKESSNMKYYETLLSILNFKLHEMKYVTHKVYNYILNHLSIHSISSLHEH